MLIGVSTFVVLIKEVGSLLLNRTVASPVCVSSISRLGKARLRAKNWPLLAVETLATLLSGKML